MENIEKQLVSEEKLSPRRFMVNWYKLARCNKTSQHKNCRVFLTNGQFRDGSASLEVTE